MITTPEAPDIKKSEWKRHVEAAESMCNKIKYWFHNGRVSNWDELGQMAGLVIEDKFRSLKFTYMAIITFCQAYMDSLPDRIRGNVDNRRKIGVLKEGLETYGSFTLKGEQQSTVNAIWSAFEAEDQRERISAGLNIARTGAGKTVIGCALVARWMKQRFASYTGRGAPVVIITKKSIKQTWRRHLTKMGLGDFLDDKILVMTYSELTSTYFKRFMFEIVENEGFADEKVVWVAIPFSLPAFVVVDESQCVNRPTSRRAKFVAAWADCPTVNFVFMSATPFVTINDTKNFCCAAKVEWNGSIITPATFSAFAGSLAADPSKPNKEAMERFKKIAGKNIFITPSVKWDHASFDSVRLCEFKSAESKMRYLTAQQRYLDFCARAGKNTNFGRFERLVELMQMVQAVEPERIPQILEWTGDTLSRKRYALLFYRTRDAVIRSVLGLTEMGVPRDKISIIWGGSEEIKKEQVYTDEQIEAISHRILNGESITRKERRMLMVTALWKTDKAKYQDADENEQQARYERMKSLGLYSAQTEEARQVQVDRFTEGDTWVLVGTIASGGTGLSLDHSTWASRPRDSYITPVYSAHEFLQAFGRGLRRTTLSDIYQYACLMKGTIEEDHVAPLLDEKLASLRTLTSFDTIDMMEQIAVSYAKEERNKKIRSLNEVVQSTLALEEGQGIEVVGDDDDDEEED